MTTATSAIDAEKKIVTSGGYTLTALGTSTITDGAIQSATTETSQTAGVELDKDILQNASVENGLTINMKLNISTLPKSDWTDLILNLSSHF